MDRNYTLTDPAHSMNFGIVTVSGTVVTLTLVMAGLWWLSKNSSRKRLGLQNVDVFSKIKMAEAEHDICALNPSDTITDSNTTIDLDPDYMAPAEYNDIISELQSNKALIFGESDLTAHQQDTILLLAADLVNPYKFTTPDALVGKYHVQVLAVEPEYFSRLTKFDANSNVSGCAEIGYRINNDYYVITGEWFNYVSCAVVCAIMARDRIGYVGDLYYA